MCKKYLMFILGGEHQEELLEARVIALFSQQFDSFLTSGFWKQNRNRKSISQKTDGDH